MAEKIVMLALSPTMEVGTIVKWRKQEGEKFSSGDVLCDVETDKATMDYEASNEGTLLKITANEGARVKVGEVIAISGSPGEDISGILTETGGEKIPEQPGERKPAAAGAPRAPAVSGGAAPKKPSAQPQPAVEPAVQGEKLPGGVKSSPLARELASKNHIDMSTLKGSGPGGRIVKEDVEKAIRRPEKEEERLVTQPQLSEERIPVSEKRRVIAKRLSESMYSSPHYYVTMVVNAEGMLDARKRLNERREEKISLNAFIMKFAAEAIRRFPAVNSTWDGDFITRHGRIDIGVAVALNDGLITPVVRNCESKGITAIDRELNELVGKARSGRLTPEEYTNATFTMSNLGSYGVREFTAIINPPGSAILAVGEVYREPVVREKDQIVIQSSMHLTLSCDHRVIDGAVAAEFLRELKAIMEDPVRVLY